MPRFHDPFYLPSLVARPFYHLRLLLLALEALEGESGAFKLTVVNGGREDVGGQTDNGDERNGREWVGTGGKRRHASDAQ